MLEIVCPHVAELKLEPGQDVEAGLAEKVIGYLQGLTAGLGAVRATLKKYIH